jgi:hypothetical protein
VEYALKYVRKMRLKALKISCFLLLFLVSAAFCIVDTTSTHETIVQKLELPAPIRGVFSLHLPLTTFSLDSSTGGGQIWFPAPEMGLVFTPIMLFEDYYFEFPISMQTIPPFLDDLAALGDISLGANFRTFHRWGFGMSYRYLQLKHRSSTANVNGHLWTFDVGVPYQKLRLQGMKFEWLISGSLEYKASSRPIKRYDGNAIMFSPYWTFDTKYGRLEATWRTMIYSHFTGMKQTGELWDVKTPTLSEFELMFTYP